MTDKALESDSERSLGGQHRSRWTRKRKFLVGGIITLVVVAIAIGLGVGLGIGLNRGGDDDNNNNNSGNGSKPTGTGPQGPVPTVTPIANPSGIWQPAVGTTWDYPLGRNVSSTSPNNTVVWGLDLYNTPQNIISGFQSNGAKVICYFSAGSWENFRSDASDFNEADLGQTLDGWPNEKWLNISSNSVRYIMLQRLDLAKSKGCDGVDPDNVDGFNNKNGLGLTQQNSVDYMIWLAGAAQSRNMSIGLKNAGDIIPDVIEYMQWSINEQCLEFTECDTFQPFIEAGKPVFHVEYPKGDSTNNNDAVSTETYDKICQSGDDTGFSTIIKNIILDAWIETC